MKNVTEIEAEQVITSLTGMPCHVHFGYHLAMMRQTLEITFGNAMGAHVIPLNAKDVAMLKPDFYPFILDKLKNFNICG